MRLKLTFSLAFATFFTILASAQIKNNREFITLKVDCAGKLADDTVGIRNIGPNKDTFRWTAISKRMPAGWDWTICDPKECSAPGTLNNWFVLASNEFNNIKFDFTFPAGTNDSALVHMDLYKSGDSLNTVKVLKFSAKVNCPASSIQSLNNIKYSFVNNILTIPAGTSGTEVAIYNTTGKQISTFELKDEVVNRINLNHLNNGVYIAKIKFDNTYKTIKLMVD